MTKRRAFIIIITIILLILGIIGVLWQRSRKIAIQNGKPAPSFREFIGLGTTAKKNGGANDQLSSEFTSDIRNNANSAAVMNTTPSGNGGGTNGNQVLISTFTSGAIIPGGTTGGSGTPGSGTGSSGGTIGGGTPPSGGGGNPVRPVDSVGSFGAGCSDADTNIAFTSQEKADLDRLRARFERIASRLHNSSDANQELDNFDEYTYTIKRAGELTAWCQSKAPIFTTPELKVKVATPFWNETGDVLRYIFTQNAAWNNACRSPDGWFHFHGRSRSGWTCWSNNFEAPANFIIEDALRLNLW